MYLFFLYHLIIRQLTIERYNNSQKSWKKTLKHCFLYNRDILYIYTIYIYILYIDYLYIYIIYIILYHIIDK